MKKIYFLLVSLFLFTSVNSQIINFPDANFKAKLLEANSTNSIAKNLAGNNFKIDTNNDGEIQESEALQVQVLGVSSSNIISLVGIKKFSNLRDLFCGQNQLLTLDLTDLQYLQKINCPFNQINTLYVNGVITLNELICNNNQLTSIDFTTNLILKTLNCSHNIINSLNLSGLMQIISLDCSFNQLNSLDISNKVNLNYLICNNNMISNINVANCQNLSYFICNSNQISVLNVSTLSRLARLDCFNNILTTLNLTGLINLINLDCSNNQLTSLFIKNGYAENPLNFYNNPSLVYICADDNQLTYVQNGLNVFGYSTTCNVNSYCSFTPGGTFYTIQGNNKYDENNNGCDVLDLPLSNLKYSITNGTNFGSLISNATGNYTIPVQAGTHTITPVLENPSYFNASPSTVNVTFPTQASPFTQNFCITTNGVHPDLEISLLPINAPRPGFDATYKIIYKNKGNTTQSGNVNLVFNDAVLDLVVASPVTSTQTLNNLSWAFTNLQPFETREINLTVNVNSPMETPAVNSGFILNYTATIISAANDDLPNDNTFVYNQTVVNSYDPNDKTCLEGATISPTKVGDFVHYMIRFENNGTANAQNIVVKDMIDLAKFDINSIVPIKGSHSFVTNITAGNKVEFIFENINLPFDDANNDGFVAFKIKTKSTLVLGNSFTNNASIYFDYNFPIVTNVATTTIAALSVKDFEFSNYFNLYPNPVANELNINAKESISVSSINIYNTLGQLVLVIANAQDKKTVDVSSLTTGNYFIKINSDKGTSNSKFIKL